MIVTVVSFVDVDSFSPWGTAKLFVISEDGSCWKSLIFAIKLSLFLLFLLCGEFGEFGGEEGVGEFSWGFFLLNLFLLDVARPWWVNNWIFPSTFMKILCLVWGWGFFLLGNNLEFPVIIFGAILGFAFSFPRFRFGVGGFISSLGLDNLNCKLLVGLVSGLWLVGRVGCGGRVRLVGRDGDIAVHLLLKAPLVWLGGLVPGLVLVGRVCLVGWV